MSDSEKPAGGDERSANTTARSQAAARRLSGGRSALGRNNTTGANALPASSGSQPVSEPISSPTSSPPTSSNPEGNAVRDEVHAKRRASVRPVGGLHEPGAPRPQSKPPPPAKNTLRKRVTQATAAVLVVFALLVAALYAKQWQFENSDVGRVRTHLVAWEFSPRDPVAREARFAELDKLGAVALTQSVEILADEAPAQQGDSRSTRPLQQIANLYLLRHAANVKVDPPPVAKEVVSGLFEGRPPTRDQWKVAQDAWRAWVTDVIARGLIPKG